MNLNILLYVAVVIGVVMTMIIIRYLVKLVAPRMGTSIANMVVGAAAILEISNQLPWSTIFDSKTAAMISFGIILGNMLLAKLKNDELQAKEDVIKTLKP